MPINYSLLEKPLASGSKTYVPKVHSLDRVGKEALASRITQLGSKLNRSVVMEVLDLLGEAALELLLEGHVLDVAGIVEIHPKMQGVFRGSDDGFDKSRHLLGVDATPSADFISEVRCRAIVVKLDSPNPAPYPVDYYDSGVGAHNGPVTPGVMGTLEGCRLKFNPSASDEGVYFIEAQGNKIVKVTEVLTNSLDKLDFIVPVDLTSGEHRIQIRARMPGCLDVCYSTLLTVLSVL